MIGTKVRALADSGAPRDLIDVFAASRRWTNAELEEFGRRHARGRCEREDLQANLTGAEWTDDEAFAAYGLDVGKPARTGQRAVRRRIPVRRIRRSAGLPEASPLRPPGEGTPPLAPDLRQCPAAPCEQG